MSGIDRHLHKKRILSAVLFFMVNASAHAQTIDQNLVRCESNDVNVATCRATGDFFRAWGMPGARFESRMRGVGSREGSVDDEGKEDQ